jgi:hypothetical protein
MHYIPFLSTLVTFIFVAGVFNRYRYKKGKHLLFWGIGLVFFGLGTLSEVVMSFTYSTAVLKLWYLSGAMLTAAWLGQGTVFLLVRKRGWAAGLATGLILLSLISAVLIALAPVTEAASTYNTAMPISTQYKAILVRSGAITLLTVLFNIYGTLGLVGGALYSAFLFWRKRVLANRMVGNVLIAGGALLPAMAGSFVQAGIVDALYVSELLGVILMYVGFLQATAPQTDRAAQPAISAR